MLKFHRLDFDRKTEYEALLQRCGRGCEYSFVNLRIWGRQEAAFLGDSLLFYSQFERSSVYPFPLLGSDPRAALDAVMADARRRGIRCRMTGLLEEECALLERLYPGSFRFYPDRDGFDYVYSIDALATLKGKKLQKKRNHLNKFRQLHPDCRAVEMTPEDLPRVLAMAEEWYALRLQEDPSSTFRAEHQALTRAVRHFEALALEGMLLVEGDRVLAMTMASRLCPTTYDVHFEKARADADGASIAICSAFAAHLKQKYPQLLWLNREDDMGIPGLRQAKLSLQPDHMVEKYWCKLMEEDDVY